MKKIVVLTVFVLLGCFGYAQQILQKTFDDIAPQQTIRTSDGGFLVASMNAVLLKIDSTYNQQWVKSYSDSIFTASFFKVIELSNGTYLMSGQSNYQSQGTWYSWLMQTDALGNILKVKTYNGENVPQRLIPIENADGTITVGGSQLYTPFGSVDPEEHFLLMKLDTALNVLWAKNYFFRYQEYFTDMILDNSGNYILQAYSFDSSAANDYRSDILIIKMDTTGIMLWAKQCGNFVAGAGMGNGIATVWYEGGKVLMDASGNIINGFSSLWYVNNSDIEIVLQKLDSNGNELFSHRIQDGLFNSIDLFSSALIENNGNLIFTDFFRVFNLGQNFNTNWVKRISPYNPNYLNSFGKELFRGDSSRYISFGRIQLSFNFKVKTCLIITDSLANIGCNSYSLGHTNQIVAVPNINILNQLTTTTVVINDSSFSMKDSVLTIADSILCLTATSYNEPFTKSYDYTVFPNPFTSYFIFKNNTEVQLQFKLSNVMGIIQRDVYSVSAFEKKKIDVSHLPSGIYFLYVYSNKSSQLIKITKL